MNDVLSLINLEILGEEQARDSWKIKDSRTLFRYYDGIVRTPDNSIPLKGVCLFVVLVH